MTKTIPTEPIGSIPRTRHLIESIQLANQGKMSGQDLEKLFDDAVADTIKRFEETGSPVITDGEQRKASFATYPVHGLRNLGPAGLVIPFKDGRTRQLPVLTSGPFRYARFASESLRKAKALTNRKLKQPVISASMLSFLYPAQGIKGYSREQFIDDLVHEAAKDIRQCLAEGATVQIDFTEGRLAVKLDPSKGLLKSLIELNNRVLGEFSAAERERIGVHTCPGGDHDSTHSADVDYSEFLSDFFQIQVGTFFVQLASENDRTRVLRIMKPFATGSRRLFVGVTDPIDPRIETPEVVRDRIFEALEFISPEHLGTADDCGFSPFCDDTSTSRDVAFAKIRARIEGTRLAEQKL